MGLRCAATPLCRYDASLAEREEMLASRYCPPELLLEAAVDDGLSHAVRPIVLFECAPELRSPPLLSPPHSLVKHNATPKGASLAYPLPADQARQRTPAPDGSAALVTTPGTYSAGLAARADGFERGLQRGEHRRGRVRRAECRTGGRARRVVATGGRAYPAAEDAAPLEAHQAEGDAQVSARAGLGRRGRRKRPMDEEVNPSRSAASAKGRRKGDEAGELMGVDRFGVGG